MSTKDKKVTSDAQDGLKDKIDSLTVMMDKLATKDNGMNKQFKLQIYKSKWRGKSRSFMINIIMIEETIKLGIDQKAEIDKFSIDKIEVNLGMDKITGLIIGEETLEVTWEHIKSSEDRIIEEDIEEIIGMKIITEKEVGVGLEEDHIQTIIAEGETGVVVIVDQGQDQEQVQIYIELGVINVENMITSQRIALPPKKKEI